MGTRRRELKVAPKAVENLAKFHPSDDELRALFNCLQDLAGNPRLGYRVAFSNLELYRVDSGRFRVHYRFDETKVEVGYIGAY